MAIFVSIFANPLYIKSIKTNKNMTKYTLYAVVGLSILSMGWMFCSSSPNQSISAGLYGGYNEDTDLLMIKAPQLPDNLDLAGEPVPMERFEVRERIDREMIDHLYKHGSTLGCFKLANRYFPVIEPILAEHGVPDDFKYLAVIESTLRNLKSPAGAFGIWQFMKATALQYGLEVNDEVDERLHIEKVTAAACRYLLASKSRQGSWTAAAAAYNAGDGRIGGVGSNQLSNNYWDMVLVSETSRYVPRIVAMKELMKNSEKYGYHLEAKDLYPALDDIYYVDVDGPVASWPAFAQNYGISYSTFKFYNPWIVGNSLTNKARKVYKVTIPKNQK